MGSSRQAGVAPGPWVYPALLTSPHLRQLPLHLGLPHLTQWKQGGAQPPGRGPPAYPVISLQILRFEASCSAPWLPQKPWLRVEMLPILNPSPPLASRQSELESYLLTPRS